MLIPTVLYFDSNLALIPALTANQIISNQIKLEIKLLTLGESYLTTE